MRVLLPDAPNANGWPYRLMVAVDGYYSIYGAAKEAGLITHAMSIERPGGYHFRFKELLKNRAMVWLPYKEGQSLPQVIDDELAYIEHFVSTLPADAGLLVYSKGHGTQALACAMGLLARRVGWERAGELAEELRQVLPGKVGPNTLLVDAWRKRLSARQEFASSENPQMP